MEFVFLLVAIAVFGTVITFMIVAPLVAIFCGSWTIVSRVRRLFHRHQAE